MNDVACRLPSVIVPVLSSSRAFHVARGFHRAAGHGHHVALNQAIHSRDSDGREQSADGRRNQANQQRHSTKTVCGAPE